MRGLYARNRVYEGVTGMHSFAPWLERLEKRLGERVLDEVAQEIPPAWYEDDYDALLTKERDFAENSPMPPAEFAEHGVYCTGDDCHKIEPKWVRPKSEAMPPKSSVTAVWKVEGFGEGQGSAGGIAPIHFGDTTPTESHPESASQAAPKTPAKKAGKKPARVAVASSRKARR